jgi:hypothetical protein
MIGPALTGTGQAVKRQFGFQNVKHRLIRVTAAELSVMTALDGPPHGWQQWVACIGAAFAGLWTSEERAEAELPPKQP